MRYKENITSIPTYNDGCFELYEIKQKDTTYPEEYIKRVTRKPIWFKELSISNNIMKYWNLLKISSKNKC